MSGALEFGGNLLKVLLLKEHRRPVIDRLPVVEVTELGGMNRHAARLGGFDGFLYEAQPLAYRAEMLVSTDRPTEVVLVVKTVGDVVHVDIQEIHQGIEPLLRDEVGKVQLGELAGVLPGLHPASSGGHFGSQV